jgi:hypothetical protein
MFTREARRVRPSHLLLHRKHTAPPGDHMTSLLRSSTCSHGRPLPPTPTPRAPPTPCQCRRTCSAVSQQAACITDVGGQAPGVAAIQLHQLGHQAALVAVGLTCHSSQQGSTRGSGTRGRGGGGGGGDRC